MDFPARSPYGPPVREELIASIRAAFAGVPAPALTRHRFDAFAEPFAEPVELPADWGEVEVARLEEEGWYLEAMEPEAFRYFLPVVLTYALRAYDPVGAVAADGRRRVPLPKACYSLALALDLVFTRPTGAARARACVEGLSMAQCAALEEALIALDSLDQAWARRGLMWIARCREAAERGPGPRGALETSAQWWEHLHDRHALAEDLVREIERAFDGVPPPDEAHETLHQAEAHDSGGVCDRSRDALGRWQEVPDQHILECQWALPWLDAQGTQHYLPAIMTYVLRTASRYDDEGWHDGPSHLSQTGWAWLTFLPEGPRRERLARSLALFTREQRQALGGFLLFQEPSPALREAWQRVMRAERDEARPDWFEILCGDLA